MSDVTTDKAVADQHAADAAKLAKLAADQQIADDKIAKAEGRPVSLGHADLDHAALILRTAQDAFDLKARMVNQILRPLLRDGSGDAKHLAAATQLAHDYHFTLVLADKAEPVKADAKTPTPPRK
jgi:hypothetical protein